jgi:hypothetical protein
LVFGVRVDGCAGWMVAPGASVRDMGSPDEANKSNLLVVWDTIVRTSLRDTSIELECLE